MDDDGRKITYPIRLNRYIAICGIASRRRSDELISSGRVKVDGQIVQSLGHTLVSPASVEVDGHPIAPTRKVYIAMNKPRGVVSAVSDERERTVIDLLPAHYRQLGIFPVGRLDLDSTGLIILTNDGDLANEILHPSHGVERTYIAKLRDPMSDELLERWRGGLMIDDKFARPIKVDRVARCRDPRDAGTKFRIVLGEGFKREIRLIARALGNRVSKLKRIAFGDFYIQKLPRGGICEYNNREIMELIFGGRAVKAPPTGIGRKLQDVSEG